MGQTKGIDTRISAFSLRAVEEIGHLNELGWAHFLGIPYDFRAGPLEIGELARLETLPESANCQLLAQLVLAKMGMLLDKRDILSEAAYTRLGSVVADGSIEAPLDTTTMVRLPTGTVVFSRAKREPRLDVTTSYTPEQLLHVSVHFSGEDDLAKQLFAGEIANEPIGPFVIHSTSKIKSVNGGGRSVVWPLSIFELHYTVLRARVLPGLHPV